MAEASAMNSVNRSESVKNCVHSIKVEKDLVNFNIVKGEPQECAVCLSRTADCVELCLSRTASGALLTDVLSKLTRCDVFSRDKHACRSCVSLLSLLEQAELEYLKLKETFEALLSKNPLYINRSQQTIKAEPDDSYNAPVSYHRDSEDEPLAVTKKKRRRKVVTRKKKTTTSSTSKRKPKTNRMTLESEEVPSKPEVLVCDGAVLGDVKKEDSMDGSESSSQLTNGLQCELKIEMDDFADDDDDDDDYFPDDPHDDDKDKDPPKKRGVKGPRKIKMKDVYHCEQCNARYTSLKRFEMHKEKHSGGKPPYICEVCGASYKHKRACDIHIALHQGISDWKCEECNKLFPSKGALQRHNNIHTGKLNYQCDLCGKSFIHTSSFKMHKLSHSGVKPHTCDICGLALMTRSHLKRHKRVHSGEKRHECPVCGKRFSERYNLIAHSKSHESAGEVAPSPAPRRRLFRCTFCQERFERRYMLERHMSLAHNRTLERAPATPRNTMSKLLKAQAQARADHPPHPAHHPSAPPAHHPPPAPPANTPTSDITDTKEERSPDSRITSILSHNKIQLGAGAGAGAGGGGATTWSSAYVAEFGLRTDYTH